MEEKLRKITKKNDYVTPLGKFYRACRKLHKLNCRLPDDYFQVDMNVALENAKTAIQYLDTAILAKNWPVDQVWYQKNVQYVKDNVDWLYCLPKKETELCIDRCKDLLMKDERFKDMSLIVDDIPYPLPSDLQEDEVLEVLCQTWFRRNDELTTKVANGRVIDLATFCYELRHPVDRSTRAKYIEGTPYAFIIKDEKHVLVDADFVSSILQLTFTCDNQGQSWYTTLKTPVGVNPKVNKNFPMLIQAIPQKCVTLQEFVYYVLNDNSTIEDTSIVPMNGILEDCRLENLRCKKTIKGKHKSTNPAPVWVLNELGLLALPKNVSFNIDTRNSNTFFLASSDLLVSLIGKRQYNSSKASNVSLHKKLAEVETMLRRAYAAANRNYDAECQEYYRLLDSYNSCTQVLDIQRVPVADAIMEEQPEQLRGKAAKTTDVPLFCRIQRYDPSTDPPTLLDNFESAEQAVKFLKQNKIALYATGSNIRQHAKENKIYKGFRWFLLTERTADPNIAYDIGATCNKATRNTGRRIAYLSEDFKSVIKLYARQMDAASDVGVSREHVCVALKKGNGRWRFADELDNCLKDTIDLSMNPVEVPHHLKKTIRCRNVRTGETLEFDSVRSLKDDARLGISKSKYYAHLKSGEPYQGKYVFQV